jgi:hypothetical protein
MAAAAGMQAAMQAILAQLAAQNVAIQNQQNVLRDIIGSSSS